MRTQLDAVRTCGSDAAATDNDEDEDDDDASAGTDSEEDDADDEDEDKDGDDGDDEDEDEDNDEGDDNDDDAFALPVQLCVEEETKEEDAPWCCSMHTSPSCPDMELRQHSTKNAHQQEWKNNAENE
jgi:hypothetical protein